MQPFEGRRIALLEARMSSEMAEFVRRFGGTPYQVPALREIVQPGEAAPFIEALIATAFSTVIFLTAGGVKALLQEASHLGSLESTLTALRLARIACRGPKPTAVLRQHDIHPAIIAAEPYTSRELLQALDRIDLSRETVALVHHGEWNAAIAAALSARGAQIEELLLYEWRMPDDLEPLQTLVRELIEGRVDALVFTTQIQCRHLFRVAGDLGLCGQLAEALNNRVVVAAVGPICTEVLRFFGVTAHVVPAHPKLGPLMNALAAHYRGADAS
jgi:uroporphyrinogen-III synthase